MQAQNCHRRHHAARQLRWLLRNFRWTPPRFPRVSGSIRVARSATEWGSSPAESHRTCALRPSHCRVQHLRMSCVTGLCESVACLRSRSSPTTNLTLCATSSGRRHAIRPPPGSGERPQCGSPPAIPWRSAAHGKRIGPPIIDADTRMPQKLTPTEAALREAALDYHRLPTPGKIAVSPTKPLTNQRDLSLAYSPGVAYPCLDIAEDARTAADYTSRGNLVGVVTNGTAVLGLGDIGPLAAKPVMEGKGCLFKKFAGIDVFDIELAERDPDKLIEVIAALEPTLGGINLEDIKAPECFYIERKLTEGLNIPVFHDDQHGTAIIAAAARHRSRSWTCWWGWDSTAPTSSPATPRASSTKAAATPTTPRRRVTRRRPTCAPSRT